MAQDVLYEMAEDAFLLNEDGNLNTNTDVKEIIYHPSLNVIIICTNFGVVRVLDVNSGVILQSTNLSAENGRSIICKYIPIEDRVLICDGQSIGVRTDYNGVLLLESILQKGLTDPTENVKIELSMLEAAFLKQCVAHSTHGKSLKLYTELQTVVEAVHHSNKDKRGIKSQKWKTVCITLPIGELKQIMSALVKELIAQKVHNPLLQVASAVMERIWELMGEPTNAGDKRMMASEARRRETFSQWPHMDYKWALPEQMAQAGFYHQPNTAGDDRAMCFTCTVCLVSWERTDEPWSEHERHSPTCPFVIGEYTQNVPISVSKATGPAIDATFRGNNIELIGTSSIPKFLPTSTNDGLISVFDVSGKIERTHSFFVTHFDSHILEKLTHDFGSGFWNDEKKVSVHKRVTALSIVSDKAAKEKAVTKSVRPTIICGITISQKFDKNSQDNNVIEPTLQPTDIFGFLKVIRGTDLDRDVNNTTGVYLVVYDFMFNKEQEEPEDKSDNSKQSEIDCDKQVTNAPLAYNHISLIDIDSSDLSKKDEYVLLKELTSFYKTLIPGESDSVFLPPVTKTNDSPKKNHTGPRLLTVDINNSEADFVSASDMLGFLPPYQPDSNETSISDHIVDLKNNQSNKRLNYSRTVQCISLPVGCKRCKGVQIKSILTTQDGAHILVTVCSTSAHFLIVYALNFSNKMVTIDENYLNVRHMVPEEKPVEISLLPSLDKLKMPFAKLENGIEGNVIIVCADGAVRIIELSTLKTACIAKIDDKKFVSAVYCNSLDRLCVSTSEGSLHFYELNEGDYESTDDHEEDDIFPLNADQSVKDMSAVEKLDIIRCFKEPPAPIPLKDLKTLQKLTLFSPVRSGYNVTVPPCWSEFQQAMRQRRNTSIINTESSTKTWRLQTDTTTWEEHIFEIALPTPVHLGHVDVHFTLQSGCTKPRVEVSLLRQSKGGIGRRHGKDVKFSVDDSVTIDMLRRLENPVVSEEYLRAHNADLLVGPVSIGQYLDLTDQSGIVTLTSPRLFKVKVRNLLLHIRAVFDKDAKKPKDSKGNVVMDKLGIPTRKNTQYLGCDCIHELSIALYGPSENPQIIHERIMRNLMLDSNVFVQSLLNSIITSNNRETHQKALDILNWIASIKLVPSKRYSVISPDEQVELIFTLCIDENMLGLLRKCLLRGSRSIAHNCMLFLLTCSRETKNISDSFGNQFDNVVLRNLLTIMTDIKQVKSPLALQWLFALLLKMTKKDTEQLVGDKCISLLKETADELIKRSNPFHLLLRSRYGLYGLPTEPEIFDIEPPTFVKDSCTNSYYNFTSTAQNAVPATEASGIIIGPDYTQEVPQKTDSPPRDTIKENKLKNKHIFFPRPIKGLIEAEPLHFSCINTSEGTRIEMADSVNATMQTAVNNIFPIVLAATQPTQKETKKEDFQSFVQKYMDTSPCFSSHLNDIIENNFAMSKAFEEAEQKMAMAYKNLFDYNKSINSQSTSSVPINQATTENAQEQAMIKSCNLPWQQLLVPPAKQVIVVERMHSGAKRHVILDFGDSVSLTDIIIPSCSDLVSLTIDVWLFGEEVDSVRLVTSSDIGTKNLILNDLQPPPLCRFMRVTLVGRYGMSTTRCRIPLGYFYGHVIILPEDVPGDIYIKPRNYEKQLGVLSKLLEDISCRYSLVCSKLKDYLQPFLIADVKNTCHLSSYLRTTQSSYRTGSKTDEQKLISAYTDAVTYQLQMNTVRNVMSRIEEGMTQSASSDSGSVEATVSTDKLNFIAEGLLEVLLSVDKTAQLPQDLCQHLFKGLCVSEPARIQLLGAMFLEKSSGSSLFWGNFLADTLVELFSTSSNSVVQQDRLFVLLIYLSRKSPENSAKIDAAMRVVYKTLKPIETNRSLLLAVNVDLPFLSWLLMYLSLQLTFDKREDDRWEWVHNEITSKLSTTPSADSQAKVKILGSWKNNTSWSTVKEFKTSKGGIFKKTPGAEASPAEDKLWDPTSLIDLMRVPQSKPQFVDTAHCLAVARLLLKFINSMDHSASADMMILSFKIISKLATMAKLQLWQLLTESQLLNLIHFTLACKVHWAPFALLCFLQDALDLQIEDLAEVMEVDREGASSSSWGSSTVNELANEDDSDTSDKANSSLDSSDASKTKSKPMNNLSFPPLPSVFETDSNDSDIEEVLETFEKVKPAVQMPAKLTFDNSKFQVSALPTTCTTIDARLEIGLSSMSEIGLQRLTTANTHKLLQNVLEDRFVETECGLLPWPEQVDLFAAESTVQNAAQMLSYCFDQLLNKLQTMNPDQIEDVLHLWVTLNCIKRDSKFDSSATPIIQIQAEPVVGLISALAWTPGLSLKAWCLGLQALTLVCNAGWDGGSSFSATGMLSTIVNHRDFVQLFVNFLSGSGIAFRETGAAGPTLCKALHDFLVRLQVRCDIVSQCSKLGNLLKTVMLNVVYQLSRPGGPIFTRLGPLDAQCKLFQSILYLDFTNIDISIGMSTLESASLLLNHYFTSIDNVKCLPIGDKRSIWNNNFSDIFAGVLGTDATKPERSVSYEDLLINLLKLFGKLAQTPMVYNSNSSGRATNLSEPSAFSQTDESKAEQINQFHADNLPSQLVTPFFADTVLQHHPTIISLCKCLASSKRSRFDTSSDVPLKNILSFSEPTSVEEAIFQFLCTLVKKATRRELVMEPLLMFLSQKPDLNRLLTHFIHQVLDNEEAVACFYNAGGIQSLASNVVSSINVSSSVSKRGTITTVLEFFNKGSSYQHENEDPTHKSCQNTPELCGLINFAPSCTITCQSITSQPADVLIQGGSGVTHRRSRSALWSHNLYQDETHTDLLLELPTAVLLKEVQLQPHASSLATCPSYVAIETSADGPRGLVPACYPLATSGMTSIRLGLPSPKVVNCVLIRLYKPKVGNTVGLVQIRLLGSCVFGRTSLGELDEEYCNLGSSGILLLHGCFMVAVDPQLRRQIVESASLVPNFLNTCCSMLLVPSQMYPGELPYLESVLRELSLFSPENGMATIRNLLDNRLSIVEPMLTLAFRLQDKVIENIPGSQSACELLYQILEHQDANTGHRVDMVLKWLKATADECLRTGNTRNCSPTYVSSIASILWFSKEAEIGYDLKELITLDLFDAIYDLKMRTTNNSLKYTLDCLLCSVCYIRSELFPLLLQKVGVLVPNLSTDRAASISDDRKDAEGMTDDHKEDYANCEWYGHLIIRDLSELDLSQEQLETVALASRSPTAIQQLLDSGLPKLLNNAIHEFCNKNDQDSSVPMAKLEQVAAILQFFTNACDEKMLRDWLGSPDGSSFWPQLLHWLCKNPFNSANMQSEALVHLEEICVKFLSKCCLCHPTNQARLATVLCEVISLQQNDISGFLRRLILQLLLENEKVPVIIEANFALYQNFNIFELIVPVHPAFKQTHHRRTSYMSTSTCLGEILEGYISCPPNASASKSESVSSKKSSTISKKDTSHLKDFYVAEFGVLSMAAGNTAKDKRAKDIKNLAAVTPQSKKKRYASETLVYDIIEGRCISCQAFPGEPLPLSLNLGQLLLLIESKNITNNWPFLHLTVSESTSDERKHQTKEAIYMVQQQHPICNALLAFSSIGGLALLAQHLPTVYPEAIRVANPEKTMPDFSESEWIKLEDADDLYEDIEEVMSNSASPSSTGTISQIPPHSLTAFSLFLRLPGYADVLLKDTKKAICLLRLMLGVTDDGEGRDMLQWAVASSLATFPFEVLRQLYDVSPLCSDDGRLLRRISISSGAVQLILSCLGLLTHHSSTNHEKDSVKNQKTKEERQLYWAKGTGFGTGSTQQSWNVEQALMKQKTEEEHVTVLLDVLASYINPNDEAGEELVGYVLPPQFPEMLAKSALLPAISSYLRNDSVLDMARHIPLYKAVLKVLRALALIKQLAKLLLPQNSECSELSVSSLLNNM
ncbi:baculoviral IAP repeat-containing protein 6, partial [Dendroctonus ponderosae]|uniref:baculoviral IAP repeat-containing protein 6 n=1 Tax=Dendroctonus ponderosae TaxID=77166 RepID=UPI002035D144